MKSLPTSISTPTTGRRALAGPPSAGSSFLRCSFALMLAMAISGCMVEELDTYGMEDIDTDSAKEIDPDGVEKDLVVLPPNPYEICPNVINDGIGLMRYCRNRNIYVDNANVERAIIVIHGSGLDAKNYYDTTVTQAGLAGVDLTKTDIIAPQFFEGLPFGIWDDYYEWSGGWRYGHDALSHARSSYEIIDHIIGQLMDHRPNLQTIVVAGQSAGGQFVDRYATGTNVSHPGVDMRFWAANPGTYMWYDATRPEATCSGYNNYPYGLSARNEYMSNYSAAGLKFNAINRDIFWTVGANDTELNGSCKSKSQGFNRQERWDNHRTHIANVCQSLGYGGLTCLFHSARHIEIPNCGHGHKCSWKSATGHDILFGP